MALDEPVIVVEYDSTWPMLFASERNRVRGACGQIVSRIEHFGSTAIPGMAGKPIVDLLIGVRSLDAFASYAERFQAIGYQSFGPAFGVDYWYLRRRGPPHYNAFVAADGGRWWRTQVALRDYLRARPAEAAAYSNRKRAIFDAGSRTLLSYTQDRQSHLTALAARARLWSTT